MADYYLRSGAGGTGSGLSWANAFTTLTTALATVTASDSLWVADDHDESTAGALSLTFPSTPGLKIICAADHTTEPPTAQATTGIVENTGNNNLTLASGFAYIYGITFRNQAASNGAADITIHSTVNPTALTFDNCSIQNRSTNNSARRINFGATGAANMDDYIIRLLNCTLSVGATAHLITFRSTRLEMIGCSLHSGSSTPTSLFTLSAGSPCDAFIHACDWSGKSWTNALSWAFAAYSKVVMSNCKLPASITDTTGANPGPGGPIFLMHNCDSADTNYRISENYYEGSIVQETTIVRTSGASDGTTPESLKMVSSGNTAFWRPLSSPDIVFWNETIGSAIDVGCEVVTDNVTLTNAEAWAEVEYLGTSGVPLGTVGSDRVATFLTTAANQASSSVTWTTTGLTTPVKQRLSVSVTPQEKGWIIVRIKLAKASTTMYVDPYGAVSSARQSLLPAHAFVNQDAQSGGSGGGIRLAGHGGLVS